jgi:hypothetical protein
MCGTVGCCKMSPEVPLSSTSSTYSMFRCRGAPVHPGIVGEHRRNRFLQPRQPVVGTVQRSNNEPAPSTPWKVCGALLFFLTFLLFIATNLL